MIINVVFNPFDINPPWTFVIVIVYMFYSPLDKLSKDFSFLIVVDTSISKTVKNKITIIGPSNKPFIPNTCKPPNMEKKITNG